MNKKVSLHVRAAMLAAGFCLSFQSTSAPVSSAASPDTVTPAAISVAPQVSVARYSFTLEELGARYPFTLRGVDGSDSVPFNLRANELVVGAKLDLYYSYSPALLSDLSHINVLVNDEVVAALPVPREDAGRTLRRRIDLPPHIITEFNRLRVQLLGHYALECEDPLHSSLWASISNQSRLELDVRQLPLPDDLSILPLPFYDFRDAHRLELTFVLPSMRDAGVLESAGMVASWFGALAGQRGAQFHASSDGNYPSKGNAVVFTKSPGDLAQGPLVGPTLAIFPNPNDPQSKVLVVAGRTDDEIRLAARALVAGGNTFSGQRAIISQVDELAPRKPYDAPRWVRTDRPVTFGELTQPGELESTGYTAGPIRLPLRIPPDLFGWRERPVPIDLSYRYTVQPGQANSSLIISTRDQFLKSFALPSADQVADKSWLQKQLSNGDMLPVRATFDVPLTRLTRSPELEFKFMFENVKEGECRDTVMEDVRGGIDPTSTLDLSGYPHFMPMPNLAAFAELGFPYTRMADLSQTTVVFSNKPAPEDLSTFLTLMGRFGESTGYPGTHVSVGFGESGLNQPDKDLVVIASGDQSWLTRWKDDLPALLAGERKRIETSDLSYEGHFWPTPDPRQSEKPAKSLMTFSSAADSAVFVGFESPVTPGRSVVLIASSSASSQAYAADVLLRKQGYEGSLMGSVAIVNSRRVTPLVADYSYTVGQLGPWRRIEWAVARYWPGLPTTNRFMEWGGFLLSFVGVMIVWKLLRRLRRRR
jgi:Bacterial cellulose synthase subunit.